MPKRERKGIALCTPYEERYIKPDSDYFVDPKFNGVRCTALITTVGEVYLYSSTQKLKESVPHINEELKKIYRYLPNDLFPIVLDGELYKHGKSFQQINSIASRTKNLHPDFKHIDYHIFDLIIPVVNANQETRYNYLTTIAKYIKSDYLKFVTNHTLKFNGSDIIENLAEITSIFYNQGYEGIVIKDAVSYYEKKRMKTWLKFKPTKQDEYFVIGLQEEVDKNGVPKDSVGSFHVTGKNGKTFFVGSGLTKEQRKNIWEYYKETNIMPYRIIVKYQDLSDGGIPIFPIMVEVEYA